jgi:hypothetical protein
MNTPLEDLTTLATLAHHKLLIPQSTPVEKLSRDKAEFNMFPSKEKLLNIRIRPESKEFQELEKSFNTEKKKELNKFLEKSPKLITMQFNI